MKRLGKHQFQHGLLVLIALTFPEITRVCQETHGEFEHLPEGPARLACGFELFSQSELLLFELVDAGLIGRNHTLAGGTDNAVQKLGDLRLALGDRTLERLAHGLPATTLLFPSITEHGLHHGEHGLGRL